MKNPIPFIIALLCIQLMFRQASAQFGCTCLPEGITFTSQEQIDSFQANYPGCTEIVGEVIISGNGIQNLNGLSCLISFHGSLKIERTSLLNLTGLDNVQHIGGDFRVFYNEKLIGINGLYALDSIIGSFSIATNIKLITTSAMENLSYVGGDLWISFNEISDLTGFINLDYIGGKLGIRYEPLESLACLENLTYIGGGMSIEGLGLTDLTGLNNVTVISGNLLIASTTLTSLTGLENLTAGFIEKLNISDNPLLSDCQIESICQYLAAPNGVLTIARNAPGCNSVVELSLSCGGSMPCLPYGDYYFSTQADVDSFQSAFPGCTELEGSVWLTSGITNLNGLNSVTSIQGNLGIHGTGINNLVGLGSITSIGGDLKMSWNENLYNLLGFDNLAIINGSLFLESTHLQNLAGLESLSNVGGDIHIQENFYLESLIGLDNLDSIGGSLKLYQNDNLTSLAGLQGLNIIEGNLEVGKWPGCSGIGGNPLLTDLSGLNNLAAVNGDMNVIFNQSLLNLSGLENLHTVGGNAYISNNDSLTSLLGLEHLITIGGDLTINSNPTLVSLSGLDSLQYVNNLNITNNGNLTDCAIEGICNYLANPTGIINIFGNASGCNSVVDVAYACGGIPCLPYGNYYLSSQSDIDNFQFAFPGCTDLEGNVTISGNDIANLDGLTMLNTIVGYLLIGDYYSEAANPILASLTGLEGLTSIGGGLYIQGNTALTSLTGLESLISIGSSLSISSNPALANLVGLEGLNSIGSHLWIRSNASLTNLTGLENLTSIGGSINIGGYWGNPFLCSLAGIENIAPGSITDLTIQNNTYLSTCEVQSICEYLAAPNGTVIILNNAPGCNSPEEVGEACLGVGVAESAVGGQRSAVRVFPNPVNDKLTLDCSGMEAGIELVEIYNIFGSLVEAYLVSGQQSIITLDMSGLPAGIYFYRLSAKSSLHVISGKLIKH